MRHNFPGWKVLTFPELESTNSYCRDLIHNEEVPEGTVVHALTQTKGRGQGAKTWESEPGKNLTFSVILHPVFLNPADQFLLSMIASLAITGFLDNHIGGISIKWPNDIYVENKKTAGILIENSVMHNRIESSVMGIGVNVNQDKFSAGLTSAVSLRQITGKSFDLHQCLNSLCGEIARLYRLLRQGGHEEIKRNYTSMLYRLNEECTFRSSGREFSATPKGVDETGRLIVELPGGVKKHFSLQELEFLIP